MLVVRFLLRFLLIPLGAIAAAIVATVVVVTLSWSQFVGLVSDEAGAADAVATFLFVGPAIFLGVAAAASAMLLPGLLAVALAEIGAIRHWLYFAACGAAAAGVGWLTMAGVREHYPIFDKPTLLMAAGIAGGLAYWLVAGWNAGFWKPVFEPRALPLSVPQPPVR